jgi:hypothetical protein
LPVAEGAIIGNRKFNQHAANPQFIPESAKNKGKNSRSAQSGCTSRKNRKFLQIKPSGKSSNSYNTRRQSRLGAASAWTIGLTSSLPNQRPGVEAGKSSTWRIRAPI